LSWRWKHFTASAALVLLGGLVLATPAFAAANFSSISGSAFGESVNVTTPLSVNVTSGPTPQVTLASDGSNSPQSATVASTCAPTPLCGLLSTGTIQVNTQGDLTNGSTSSATIQNANVGAGLLSATAVGSSCQTGVNGSSGTTTLTNASLTVLGSSTALVANPPANDVINVAGVGTLTLNEQVTTGAPNNGITVNAIHLHLLGSSLGSGDVIIGQSHCDATALPPPVVPEAPLAALLPLSAAVLLGGTGLLAWRRPSLFNRSAR
jgi:hypothetical protein